MEISLFDIENSLHIFRKGRKIILNKLIKEFNSQASSLDLFQLYSNLSCRLKSADSILEKSKRKKITLDAVEDIPIKIPDILGFRIIVKNKRELTVVNSILEANFIIKIKNNYSNKPDEYGRRYINYSLEYQVEKSIYSFDIQLRTFMHHYNSMQSFHLFHKKEKKIADKKKPSLLKLSKAIEEVEKNILLFDEVEININNITSPNIKSLTDKVYLVVIEQIEKFLLYKVIPLVADSELDHKNIVEEKINLYNKYKNCVIVEYSCINFNKFSMNENQVKIPLNRINEAFKDYV